MTCAAFGNDHLYWISEFFFPSPPAPRVLNFSALFHIYVRHLIRMKIG